MSLEDKTGSKLATILSNIGHRAFGAVQSWNWGNHSATANNSYARGIDPAGRISSYPLGNPLAGGVQRKLVYDNANRITDFKHSGAANASVLDQTFGYDGQGRLTSATNASTSLGYQYDDNGNRTALQIGSNSYSNTIAPNSNRLMNTNGPVPAKTNKYDKAGNLLSDGNITFTYDPLCQTSCRVT